VKLPGVRNGQWLGSEVVQHSVAPGGYTVATVHQPAQVRFDRDRFDWMRAGDFFSMPAVWVQGVVFGRG
jgi:hypothetical protein